MNTYAAALLERATDFVTARMRGSYTDGERDVVQHLALSLLVTEPSMTPGAMEDRIMRMLAGLNVDLGCLCVVGECCHGA